MIALPAGIMASGFTGQMRLRREEFAEHVEKLVLTTSGGELTSRQRRRLEAARLRGSNFHFIGEILRSQYFDVCGKIPSRIHSNLGHAGICFAWHTQRP